MDSYAEFVSHARRVCGGLVLMVAAACAPEQKVAEPVSPLVGRWVRVYPTEGALDTLELRPDGSVSGSVAGLDSMHYAATRWQIGSDLMPGGFCIGAGRQPNGLNRMHCQGYLLRGDTLWLANQSRTAFLRPQADGQLVAWTSNRGSADAPVPGDSVRAVPVSMRVQP